VTSPSANRDYLLHCLGQVSGQHQIENRDKVIALINSVSDDKKKGKNSPFHGFSKNK